MYHGDPWCFGQFIILKPRRNEKRRLTCKTEEKETVATLKHAALIKLGISCFNCCLPYYVIIPHT